MDFSVIRANMYVGLRAGIIHEKHYQKMGMSIWLFMWCVMRQTGQDENRGFVDYGSLFTYARISAETGFKEQTVRKWMRVLVSEGYVRLEHEHSGIRIWLLKPKKEKRKSSGKAVEKQDFLRPETAPRVSRSGNPPRPNLDTPPVQIRTPKTEQLPSIQTFELDSFETSSKLPQHYCGGSPSAPAGSLTLSQVATQKKMPRTHQSQDEVQARFVELQKQRAQILKQYRVSA